MDRLLQEPPPLTALYAKALIRPAQTALRLRKPSTALPDVRHRVENVTATPEKVAAFQGLMGRFQSQFLPSGYVHTLAFPVAVSVLARRDFPLPLLGMIHLRNEVRHLHPIAIDERLSVTARVEKLLPHRSGTMADVVVDVEAASQLVWSGRSTYLAKGVQAAAPGTDSSDPAVTDRTAEDVPDYPTRVWTLDGGIGRSYAAVSGDYNPIHLSVASSRMLGMKRPIAHGMYLASRMVAEIGPDESSPFQWTIDFRAPVTLPSRVLLSAQVERSSTSDWLGAEVTAWDPKRRRTHFSGRLERLHRQAGAE